MTALRTLSIACAGAFWITASGALAGPQSLLDPYADIQAPATKNLSASKRKKPKPEFEPWNSSEARAALDWSSKAGSATAAAPAKPQEAPLVARHNPLKLKKIKPAIQESNTYSSELAAKAAPRTASSPVGVSLGAGTKEIGDGIARTAKAATSGIAGGTKTATTALIKGGHYLGGQVVSGSKKVGEGLAHTGSFLTRGVKSGSPTVMAAGGKVKEGAWSAGGKVRDGLAHSGAFLAKGVKSVGPAAAAAGGKVANGAQAAGTKIASIPTAAVNHFQSGSDHKFKGVKIGIQPRSSDNKLIAWSRSVGKGLASTTDKMKDGTQVAARKVAAIPSAMGRGAGRLLGHGQPPQATAQQPGSLIH